MLLNRFHWINGRGLIVIVSFIICVTSAKTKFKRSLNQWSPISTPNSKPFPKMNSEIELNKLTKINLTEKMEQLFSAQAETRTTMQRFVENINARLESLEMSVYPDENNYWAESESCGGIMISQTGRISHKINTEYEPHEKCIWTIRANYRSKVKIELKEMGLEEHGYDFIAVTEINRDNEQHTTKLERRGSYIFQGPLLLVTFLADWVGSGTGFTLEYEGIGRNINKDMNYKHFHINNWSGAFSSNNITEVDELKNSIHSKEYTTIVLNPTYLNVTQLDVSVDESSLMLEPMNCDKTSLTIFESFLNDNSTKNRCCGNKCDKSVSSNHDGLLLVTLQSEPHTLSKFNLDWKIDDKVSRSNSVDTCGGTISGRLGRISYKLGKEYKNNERCVWAIKPGKSKVKIILRNEDFEDGYDFVYASQINENGEIHNQQLKQQQVYNFTGPFVFITFYSDGSTTGKGFSLDWAEFGDKVAESINDPLYFDQDSGTLLLALDPPVLQFVIINPKYFDSSLLKLKFISLEPEFKSNSNVEQNGLYLYGNDETSFSLAQKYCEEGEGTVGEEFSAEGGVFILVFKSKENSQIVTKVEFSWMKGLLPEKPENYELNHVDQTEGCGGILVGDSGTIEYKLATSYEPHSRCIWIVESSRLSKISFKLTKDGFEACCDFLIATPFNVDNGSLGKSVIINRENRVTSFSDPLVFISFYSDGSYGNHGFRLDFSTSGKELGEERTRFVHNFYNETNGTHRFETLDENYLEKALDNGIYNGSEIFTTVFSPQNTEEELKSIKVEVEMNQFQSDKECHQDSLSIFQINNPKIGPNFSKTFTCSNDTTTHQSNTNCECDVESRSESFELPEPQFISVFKPLGSERKSSFVLDWIESYNGAEN